MEPFLGQVTLFPYTFHPRGWARCEGQLMSIEQNSALYALLGTQFGGDGRATFGLPKLPPVASEGGDGKLHYCIALQGVFPTRD